MGNSRQDPLPLEIQIEGGGGQDVPPSNRAERRRLEQDESNDLQYLIFIILFNFLNVAIPRIFLHSAVCAFKVVRKERLSYSQVYDKFDLAFITICGKKDHGQRTYSKLPAASVEPCIKSTMSR